MTKRIWQYSISGLGLAVLAAAFVRWWGGYGGAWYGYAMAALSAALYAAACLRFVPAWLEFWNRGDGGTLSPKWPTAGSEPAERALPVGDEPPHMGAKLFLTFLLLDGAMLLLVMLLRKLLGWGWSWDFWRCLDSGSYLTIAESGYLAAGDWDRQVQLVFLPGYPLLVRLLGLVLGNTLAAGLAVSGLCFAGAGWMVYRLLRLDDTHRDALRVLKYLCLLPGLFFFTAPMSESLFLLLSAGCLYLCRRGRWLPGCLLGAYAAFTRSLGLALTVPLFFELMHCFARGAKSALRRLPALLLIPAGFGCYLLVNYLLTGDPLRFLEYQSRHWGQQLGWFFNTAAYQSENAVRTFAENIRWFWGLWLPNLLASFGGLALLLAGARRLRPAYTAWGLVYFAVAVGATWLLSAPRYLLVLLPVSLSLGALGKRRALDRVAAPALGVCSLLYTLAFVLRWQVW